MADFEKKVRAVLAEHGCQFVRHGEGDHDIWYSPITGVHFPVDSKIKSRHTANGIYEAERNQLSFLEQSPDLARAWVIVLFSRGETLAISRFRW